jgi:hypothetical protein
MSTNHKEDYFVKITYQVIDSAAWRAMSHGARQLYVALKRRCWSNKKNNGKIFLPQRQAMEELGSGMSQIVRWFRELQYYGFIVMTDPGHLGLEGKGRAPRWRLTEVAYIRKGKEEKPTMEFLKWSGARFSKHREGGDVRKSETRSPFLEHRAPENGSKQRSRKREHLPQFMLQKTGAREPV